MSLTSHKGRSWIGFDWDRTLFTYTTWEEQNTAMGEPIVPMWDVLRQYLRDDVYDVKIFTARACDANWHLKEDLESIRRLCVTMCGRELEITCSKDFGCARIYDDVAVSVEPNTGRILTAAGAL